MADQDIYQTTATPGASFASPGPDVTFPFRSNSVIIVNEDGTAANYVEVSFDGVTVHGKLTPGTPSAGLKFSQRRLGVWLRKAAGSPVVQVIAET